LADGLTLDVETKAVRGKNGWLFLDNDTNHVLKQHAGELLFTPAELTLWQRKLETRTTRLASMSIPYRFVIPPVSSSVYPEFLPDHVKTGHTRPVLQLLAHLESVGSAVRVMYPLDALLTAKAEHDVYVRSDTHWNGYGQFVCYQLLVDEIQRVVDLHFVERKDVVFAERLVIGDLGEKVRPRMESGRVFARRVRPQAHLVFDNCVLNNGAVAAFECDEAPATSCLVFGDSFAVGLLRLLAPSFRRVVFVHLASLDYDIVEQVKPDIVLGLLNERFIYNSTGSDETAPSTEAVVSAKIAAGSYRSPHVGWAMRAPVHFGPELQGLPGADLWFT
jgi:hypothetical protein